MNKELYTFITEKRHRVWRKDYCGPDAAAWKEAGLSPRERMADRFARLCGQEEPHFLPGQKLAFIRTVKNLPDVLTEEEWADVRKKHHIHELGYLSNLSPDYAAVMGTGLLKAKETADPCTAKEIDALIELASEAEEMDFEMSEELVPQNCGRGVRIAVARDSAFSFIYRENKRIYPLRAFLRVRSIYPR